MHVQQHTREPKKKNSEAMNKHETKLVCFPFDEFHKTFDMFFEQFCSESLLYEHYEIDKRIISLQTKAKRKRKRKTQRKEEEGVHVQGGRYFGRPAAMFV